MKNVLISLVLLVAVFANSETRSNPGMEDIKAAMAYGSVIALNKLDTKIEKKLLIRLYKLPLLNGSCFVETHGACQNKYFISVSTYDELPEVNLFELNVVGEILKIRWIKDDGIDFAKIELIINKYTEEAVANNSLLKNTRIKVNLGINVNKITEKFVDLND